MAAVASSAPTRYRELAAPRPLQTVVACLWEQQTAVCHAQRVVPDGCLDVIWLSGGELVIAGADTGPRTVVLPARSRSLGVRLRPGAAGQVLGLPASELCDREVAAEAVWGAAAAALAEQLRASPDRGLAILAQAVAARGAQCDELIAAAALRLSRPGARVAAVARELGVTERTLHRRTRHAVGYGPKTLARVARLRRLIAGEGPLVMRSLEAGYASQAHMTEEVRRLTGITPVRFLKDAALTAA